MSDRNSMSVPLPQASCEFPFRLSEVQGKEENGRCAEGVERGSKSKAKIDRRWINGSKPFCMNGHARPKPHFQIAKWVKGQKHSMVNMGSKSDLWPQSISQAILVWVNP